MALHTPAHEVHRGVCTATPVIGSRNRACEAAPPVTGEMKATQHTPILFISQPSPLFTGSSGPAH